MGLKFCYLKASRFLHLHFHYIVSVYSEKKVTKHVLKNMKKSQLDKKQIDQDVDGDRNILDITTASIR